MTGGFGRFLRQNVIALLALFIALGGTSAFAASALINGAKIKNHTIAKSKLTSKAVKQLRGNRGARGATGAQGVQGPAGPGALWAEVAGNAAIARQTGGITVAHPSGGIYLINFGADVSHQLILTSSSFYQDQSFRGTILAATCGDVDTVVPGFCTSVGVTAPQNTVVLVTTAAGDTGDEDHPFFVAAVGPNATSAPTGARPQHIPSGGALAQALRKLG